MLVDITQGDFTEPFDESFKKILPSILAKCIKKSEDVSESDIANIKIRTFYLEERYRHSNPNYDEIKLKGKKDSPNAPYKIKMKNDKIYNAFNDFSYMMDEGAPVLHISMSNEEIAFLDDGLFKPSPSAVFVFPTDAYISDKKDFALNIKFGILTWNSTSGYPNSVSLGGLCDLFIKDFKTNGWNSRPKPQVIAKALGYEVPDNYTPGQGVEKTKA